VRGSGGCRVPGAGRLALILALLALGSLGSFAGGTARAGTPEEIAQAGGIDAVGTVFDLSGLGTPGAPGGPGGLWLTSDVEIHLVSPGRTPAAIALAVAPTPNGAGVTALLSLTGLTPLAPYFVYRDGLAAHEEVWTDASGALALLQSVAEPHLVMVQDSPSTLLVSSSACPPGWTCTPAGGPFATALAPAGALITDGCGSLGTTVMMAGPRGEGGLGAQAAQWRGGVLWEKRSACTLPQCMRS
jgi:hypothetical protein